MENSWIHTFSQEYLCYVNNQPHLRFELVSPCSFPTTITITPRTDLVYLSVCMYSYIHKHKPARTITQTCIYIYKYIYIRRESEWEREGLQHSSDEGFLNIIYSIQSLLFWSYSLRIVERALSYFRRLAYIRAYSRATFISIRTLSSKFVLWPTIRSQ